MLLVASALIYGVLWPAVERARNDARRSHSAGQLSQLRVALHNYADTHGTYPPAYLADEDGRPMHSWRVLILPFISEEALWEQYDFDLPWNDPHNLKVARKMPSSFRSPFSPDDHDQGLTPYLAITGPDTVLGETEGRSPASLGDEAAHKLAVVQYEGQPVFWTEPTDITPQRILAEYSQIMDNSSQGINVMVLDHTIIFVQADTPREDLEAGFYVGDGRKFMPEGGRIGHP
jgi:hypothetical protein